MESRELQNSDPGFGPVRTPLRRLPLSIANLLSLILIALLATVSYWWIERGLAQQKSEADLLHLVGSQRLLAQRIAAKLGELMTTAEIELQTFISEESMAEALNPKRAALRRLAERMESNHQALAHGADPRFVRHLSPAVRALYFGPAGELDAELAAYLAETRRIAGLSSVELFELGTVGVMRTMGNRADDLLDHLNAVTSEYVAEFKQKLARTRLHGSILYASLLPLLVLVWFGLMRPTQRRLEHELRRRAIVQGELRAAKERVEERIAERTQELRKANNELAAEVDARRDAEKKLVEARDAAESATRAKSAFLATMSHEIRTPMNGVVGMIDLLRRTELDREQRDMIETVQQSARSLRQIIDDILDFSKVEAGRVELESVPFSPAELAEEVLKEFSSVAGEKFLILTAYVDPSLPAAVLGDPMRLKQVLRNLLSNAVKFTESREGRPGIVNVYVDGIGDIVGDTVTIRCRVQDTGIGMHVSARERVFNAFEQADHSTTRRFGGTGLGLAICKRLVDLMGGEIGVESEPGSGSTFYFTTRHPIVADAWETRPLVQIELHGERVLLLEPQVQISEVLVSFLEEAGAEVVVSSEGESAVGELIEATSSDHPFKTCILGPGLDAGLRKEFHKRCGKETALSYLRYVSFRSSGEQHGPRVTAPNTVRTVSPIILRKAVLSAMAIVTGRESPDCVADAVEPADGTSGTAERTLREERILVAEDNPVNQLVIRRQLHELGFECDIAGDGKRALAMLGQRTYALLLTDVHMPEMDGYALTASIREAEERFEKQHRLPIIAITANVLAGETDRCLAAGMDDFLPKPIELDELEERLRHWLPGQSAGGAADDTTLKEAIAANGFAPEKGSLLVVEEAREHQRAIIGQLTALGYPSDVVDSAKAGLKALASKPYVAVLTDVHMRNMDGIALVQAVREKETGAGRLPVIGISANTLVGERERCLKAGMDEVLEKPVERQALKRVLEATVSNISGDRSAGGGKPVHLPTARVGKAAAPLNPEPSAPEGGPDPRNGSPIDESRLDEICGDDQEIRAQILESFLDDARTNTDKILAASNARNAAAVGAAAHGLKSSARTVGAHDLADLCVALERAGRSGDLNQIAMKARSLPMFMDEIERYLQ